MEDEGEDDGSVYGEIEDDSLSEDSASSHPGDEGDGDASDVTEHELHEATNGQGQSQSPKEARRGKSSAAEQMRASPKNSLFESKVSDTEAMMNGLTLTEEGEKMEEINFEDMKEDMDTTAASNRQGNNKGGKRETIAERKKREHEEYAKEREENPAFVPTRGNFFLHDKRIDTPQNGHRNSNRVKSKPHGLIVDSNAPRFVPQKANYP